MTLGSLFDGIGVFPLASSRHDIRPVWASEIEKAPISITKRHFPEMEHVGDITKLHGGDLRPVDVITFGSPCQNLSSIGGREGLSGKASSLFFEAIRIIREMREVTNGRYPTFAVWENVAGALFSNDGADYRAVLEAFTNDEIPMPDSGKWAGAGMVCGGSPDLAWRLLDSQHHYCAQRRKRVFLLADYGGKSAAQILYNPAPLHQILTVRDGGRRQIPAPDGSGAGQAGRQASSAPEIWFLSGRKLRGGAQFGDPTQFRSAIAGPDSPCPTLLAGDAQNMIVLYPGAADRDIARGLTPLEYERAMGLPDGWTALGHDGKRISDSARYIAVGNSIAVPCAEYIMAGIGLALQNKEERL